LILRKSSSLIVLVLSVIGLLAACSLEKKSAVNRGLQNLTAHYNILFNANEVLKAKQDAYAASYTDAYNDILNVYQDTTAHAGTTADDQDLQSVTARANTIINYKEQSHYIGDAYLLLGKASFLNGDYFNATEYFGYVTRSFKLQHDLVQEARAWQGRSLIYLQMLPQAKLVLDTALQNINPKAAVTGQVYAARLQYEVKAENYTEAEAVAKKALEAGLNKTERQRITFILAQLQELNHEPDDAYANYSRIVNSNAPFVMAFNAELNRIRMEDARAGRHLSRTDRLRSLLRNENDREFADQIYYQLAELYLSQGNVDEAIKNYKLSARSSERNQTQKGLSYLRLADIYFKDKGDYVTSKQYYDSTLLNLQPTYRGYNSIRVKADNLQLLADRLQLISREDTLQMLAGLDAQSRQGRIDILVNRYKLQQQAAATTQTTNPDDPFSNTPIVAAQQPNIPNGNSFYFYNTNAVSQGFTAFKREWGNRKLEDNWRRSSRANGDITANTQNTTKNIDPAVVPEQLQRTEEDVTTAAYRQDLQQNIPYTPAHLAQSNTRIYNAYLDIANFYRDILKDQAEAITVYELLLRRFPDNSNTPLIYYNLYRLYADIGNKPKSDEYKDLLLKNFARTPYAKVILDPDYARRLDDRDAELNALYNEVYSLYAKRDYSQVIIRAEQLQLQYPNSKLAAQLAYLRAIALGHQEKYQPFKNDLQQLVAQYPNDRLITPLVNQHLTYLEANAREISARRFALMDSDPNEIPFIPAPVVQPKTATNAVAANKPAPVQQPPLLSSQPVAQIKVQQPIAKPQATLPKPATINAPQTTIAKPAPLLFSERDSTNYYFVVNVASGNTNLSSSRFGIGQFNRTTYQGSAIKHQLKPVGADNQLIYVGRFYHLEEAKEYGRRIIPLMSQIMKVPADKYSFFIITQENLDKLADRKMLDTYTAYYHTNF
jgi:tetratricopeptide (TPR) repeat protein